MHLFCKTSHEHAERWIDGRRSIATFDCGPVAPYFELLGDPFEIFRSVDIARPIDMADKYRQALNGIVRSIWTWKGEEKLKSMNQMSFDGGNNLYRIENSHCGVTSLFTEFFTEKILLESFTERLSDLLQWNNFIKIRLSCPVGLNAIEADHIDSRSTWLNKKEDSHFIMKCFHLEAYKSTQWIASNLPPNLVNQHDSMEFSKLTF